MLYYVVVVILVLSFIAHSVGRKSSRKVYDFAILLLIVFSALRNAFLYPDIANYCDFFQYGKTPLLENFGTGYTILNQAVKLVFPSFQVLLAIISVVVIGSYAKVIKDYSPSIWLSLLLYLLINYYPSFFILRQYIAIAIILLSLKYVIKREPIKFGLCAIIAFSFHATALLAVPLYLLYGMKGNVKNMIILAIGCVLVDVMFMSAAQYVNLFSTYYAGYFETEVEESMWRRVLLKIYITAVYIFTLRKKSYEEGINRLVFYGMILNVVICIAGMNIFSAHRLREYFAYADFIGVPIILHEASKLRSLKKPFIYLLVAIYIGALAITFNNFVQSNNMNNEYEFFWNAKDMGGSDVFMQ